MTLEHSRKINEQEQQRTLDLLTGELSGRTQYDNLNDLLKVLRAGTAFDFPYRIYVADYLDNRANHRFAKGNVRILVSVSDLSYEDCSVSKDSYKPTAFEITPEVWKKIQEKNQETLKKYNELKQK